MSVANPSSGSFLGHARALFSRQALRSWITLVPTSLPARKMLLMLLAADCLFIGIFVFFGLQQVISNNPAKFPQMWSLSADFSIPEFFGYAKLAFTAWLLFVTFQRTGQHIWLSWAAVFALLLADDALLLHELGGVWAASFMPFESFGGIEAHHFGELLLSAVLGVVVLAFLLAGLLRTSTAIVADSGFFLIVFMGLVICGVGIDLLSSASYFQDTDAGNAMSKTIYGMLLIAEDGGEAIFMSLGCAGAYAVRSNTECNTPEKA